jgi:hypothetical protein
MRTLTGAALSLVTLIGGVAPPAGATLLAVSFEGTIHSIDGALGGSGFALGQSASGGFQIESGTEDASPDAEVASTSRPATRTRSAATPPSARPVRCWSRAVGSATSTPRA